MAAFRNKWLVSVTSLSQRVRIRAIKNHSCVVEFTGSEIFYKYLCLNWPVGRAFYVLLKIRTKSNDALCRTGRVNLGLETFVSTEVLTDVTITMLLLFWVLVPCRPGP